MKPAFIFDMDGVLFLSNEAHFRAFREAVADHGIKLESYRPIAGMRTDAAVEHIFKTAGKDIDPTLKTQVIERKREIAQRLLAENPPLAPGCRHVLSILKQRNHSLGLATSASAAGVRLFLAASQTDEFFDVVLCGDDVRHAKPDPEIYIKAARQLGRDAEACLVVEDSANGVLAARRAGALVIGMEGEQSSEELQKSGARWIVRSLEDILDLRPTLVDL